MAVAGSRPMACGNGSALCRYSRGGTAKLLTLFCPATGAVRAQPVIAAPNTVLHPWLQDELTAILAALPDLPPQQAAAQATLTSWEHWQAGLSLRPTLAAELP